MVVVKELEIDRAFRDKEKLELNMTIATYRTKSAKKDDKDEKEEG